MTMPYSDIETQQANKYMTMSGPYILISATDMATKASHKSTVCSHIDMSNSQICPCQPLTRTTEVKLI